jgi:hypothetical protein
LWEITNCETAKHKDNQSAKFPKEGTMILNLSLDM